MADGAAWIWNLAGDRFAGARQGVDFYHVSQHLWAVAHAQHPDDQTAAQQWVEPMLDKLKAGGNCEVISDLEQLRAALEGAARQQADKEVNYWRAIVTGWTTERPSSVASRWASAPWNQRAASAKPASNAPANFGVQ